MAKLRTVNVIEYADDTVIRVSSFSEDAEGNAEAEAVFKACVKENGDNVTDEELSSFVEDGMYEQGSYQAFLAHDYIGIT